MTNETFWDEDSSVAPEDRAPGALRGAGGRSPFVWKALLVIMALMWGYSFFVMKDALDRVPPFQLLTIRFGVSSLLMFALFKDRIYKHFNKTNLVVGIGMGVIEWAAFGFQTMGLVQTTPGKNAFLTGTYCILVPFISYVISKEKLTRYNMSAAVCCLVGIGLVALDSLSVNMGDIFTLLGAFFFALQISLAAKYGKDLDVNVITFWMFAAVAVLCVVTTCTTETLYPLASFDMGLVMQLAFLSVFCTCVGLLIQNLALAHVSPATGSLLLSLESPSGVFFSVLFAGEVLTGRLVAGFALIFISIIISETHLSFLQPRARRSVARKIVYVDGVEVSDEREMEA